MKRGKRSYFFLAFLILPTLFVLQNPAIIEPVRGFSLSILKPFILMGDAASQAVGDVKSQTVYFWRAFRSQHVHDEKIAALESSLLKLQELERENERLKKLLDFRKGFLQKTTASAVIGWDPSPWRKIAILDKGTKNSVQKDMAVVNLEGLVGRVVEAGPHAAKAILLTDPDSRVSAMSDQSRAQGVISGNAGPHLVMRYLELESNVQVGETVISSGVGGIIPKGIRIGKITGISRDPSGLHLAAEIEPFVQFSKLEEVLCLALAPGK